ncbi:MAG: hypothetical protein JW941_02565 [Candidatus Coatesbacteria bacterium]|nr:hypothetical protein [Candidatus Coatesbacteria bacterium]
MKPDFVTTLPAEFESEDQAGEFWDEHSITDFEEFLFPAEFEVDISRVRTSRESSGRRLEKSRLD